MQELYDICFRDAKIGQVRVSKQGLYYVFRCMVTLPQQGSYRLWAETKDKAIDFGLFVPGNGCFELTKRVPVKNFASDHISFVLRDNEEKSMENWVPIDPNTPFAYITLLENARLKHRDGIPGAVLQKGTTARWDPQ